MRILVVTPLFPPTANAEAYVGGKFVQSLLRMGHDVQVITCSNGDKPVRNIDSSATLWRDLDDVVTDVPVPPTVSIPRRLLLSLRFRTINWTRWIADNLRAARSLHRRTPFDLVVSRAMPWHAHLAGYWIARTLRLPWFAVSNDPLDLSQFVLDPAERAKIAPELNLRLWMPRLLKNPDLLIFPSTRLRDGMLRKIKRKGPTAVLPHVGGELTEPVEEAARFTLLHAGTFEVTGRTPDTLLRGLKQAVESGSIPRDSIQLLFVGPEKAELKEMTDQLGLSDIVRWTGRVSYEDSLAQMASAHVCLLVDCSMFEESMFLPSKLIDYLSMKKPVLALSLPVGTVNDLVREGGIIRLDLGDVPGVARSLTDYWNAYREGRLKDYAPTASVSEKYGFEAIGGEFNELLRRYLPTESAPGTAVRASAQAMS